MARDFSAPRFNSGRASTSPRHRRKETLVARRTRRNPSLREMHITFEPGRLSLTWVAQAYEQIVPIARWTTSKAPGRRKDGLDLCETDAAPLLGSRSTCSPSCFYEDGEQRSLTLGSSCPKCSRLTG
jgi:hypothetical protein